MGPRHWGLTISTGIVFGLLLHASNLQADVLRYRFRDNKTPVYEVSISAELPECVLTYSGHLFYKIKSVDGSGQIDLGYAMPLTSQIAWKGTPGNDQPPPVPPQDLNARIVIDGRGNIIRSSSHGDLDQLPFTLGLAWQLALPSLPAGSDESWETSRAVSIFAVGGQTPGGGGFPFGGPPSIPIGPRPPFGSPPGPMNGRPYGSPAAPGSLPGTPQTPQHPAHESVKFKRTVTEGNLVTIQRDYDLSTDERFGADAQQSFRGDGTIVFDKQAGLVKSMELKQTLVINQPGKTSKLPLTITATLLSGEEATKLVTERAAADADREQKMQEFLANVRANDSRVHHVGDLERLHEVSELPPHSEKTAQIGLNGGSPYLRVDEQRRPMIGFLITLGEWSGHTTINHFVPLWEPLAKSEDEKETLCLAKSGYVVGGLQISTSDGADGVRVIFMKKTASGVDPKDSYMSPWYGDTDNTRTIQLAGNGERVIGIYGRQGMNTNKIGLVYDLPTGTKPSPRYVEISDAVSGKPPHDDDDPADTRQLDEPDPEESLRQRVHEMAHRHMPVDTDAGRAPEGTSRTAEIGLDGGGPYQTVDPDHRPIIGFQIRIGSWAGHTTIGHCTPLWEPPADLHPRNEAVVLAKEGYVVGGVIVNSVEGADGLQIIFMRKTAKGADPKDKYLSPWFGLLRTAHRTQLAGHGEKVIGTFGRQGLNMNKIGLVLEDDDGNPAK